MHIVLIADTFPPLRSSGAVQLRDLSLEFVRQGHELTMMVASPGLEVPARLENFEGVHVLRLRTLATKDVGYARRALAELLMPFYMYFHLRKRVEIQTAWTGVVWYSPSIFLGPLAHVLKWKNACRSYLIVRDIFPEWAIDMGIMRRGPVYWVMKAIANYQYAVADVIGVQTPGNLGYFERQGKDKSKRIEVLHNWLSEAPRQACSIDLSHSALADKKTVFVYAGNMGVAQGAQVLLDLAELCKPHVDIGFVFVGRGSDAKKLKQQSQEMALSNTLFFDEIEPEEIPGLYAQCHIGLIALDPKHKTHNIPGKFLSYMQAGLPVLASINSGNDLAEIIASAGVGCACGSADAKELLRAALSVRDALLHDADGMRSRCQALSKQMFSTQAAVEQIVSALT